MQLFLIVRNLYFIPKLENKESLHYPARKIFASTVLPNIDVPIEIVSELLGHSSIKITQEYYGKIVQRRVSEEMERISKKMR